jgi:hypothetical protein
MKKREKMDRTKPAPVSRLRGKRKRVSRAPISGLVVPELLPTAGPSVRGPSPKLPEPPWSLKVGAPCSFYHEGGKGDKHWVVGWRYGIIKHIPSRGQRFGWGEIEVPVDLYAKDEKGHYQLRPRIKAWCHLSAVNAPGDCLYHGQPLKELVRERKEEKAIQQKKADKKKRKV